MNIKKIKNDFPIFGKKGVPKELTYLDNAATSQKPQSVIDAITNFYKNQNANIYRGVHTLSETATQMYEAAREKVAKFINASSSEIIFTSGATEGINFIAQSFAKNHLKPGDEIVITQAEHHSNFLPWQTLAKELDLTLKIIPINKTTFDISCNNQEHFNHTNKCLADNCDYLSKFITPKTALVALTVESNVLGPIWNNQDLENFIKLAKQNGAAVLLDAAQSAPHGKIDIQKLNPDFLVFSGHKMLAPTGIGVLYINKKFHDIIMPYKYGGGMVYSVGDNKSTWQKSPQKFEAGTPPIASAIGLGAAIDYLSTLDFMQLQAHHAQLCAQLIEGLEQIEGVEIFGNVESISKHGHLVSFKMDKLHAHDIATYLDRHEIATRAGHHCAQPLAEVFDIDATLRVSFYIYNTKEDVQALLEKLSEL